MSILNHKILNLTDHIQALYYLKQFAILKIIHENYLLFVHVYRFIYFCKIVSQTVFKKWQKNGFFKFLHVLRQPHMAASNSWGFKNMFHFSDLFNRDILKYKGIYAIFKKSLKKELMFIHDLNFIMKLLRNL